MKKRIQHATLFAVLLTVVSSALALAQNVTDGIVQPASDPGGEIAVIATVSLLVFVVATLMYIIGVMNTNIDPIVNFFIRVRNYVIPQPTEFAPDMGHDFDGIRELDNRIPPWFNYLFALTVVFGIVYIINYHIAKISPLSAGEYQQELVEASLQRNILMANEPLLDEATLVAFKDEANLKAGSENFHKYCVSCHGQEGGGIVGPNLTDKYWIHGGGVKNVYQTIKNGVPSKGMITWGLVFSQRQILQLASYVLSLQGTNPPGGKAPQGDLYVEPKADSTAAPVAADSVKANVKL